MKTEIIFTEARIAPNLTGTGFELVLKCSEGSKQEAQALCSEIANSSRKPFMATCKRYRKKRSKDANSYAWVLIQKLSEKMDIPKVEIYRNHIREIGDYEPMPILEEDVERFSEGWSRQGLGWVCEVVGRSKLPGYMLVFAYYGSSSYDTKNMARLINNLVQDCMALDIPVLPENEIKDLIEEWGKNE